jgi:hypothetical protein
VVIVPPPGSGETAGAAHALSDPALSDPALSDPALSDPTRASATATDKRGRATAVVRFRRAGARFAVADYQGLNSGRKLVRVRRR